MFMVHTVSQLEDAVRDSAREVMVIGKLAPKMLEMTNQVTENRNKDTLPDPRYSKLCENFNVSVIRDNSENVILVLTHRDGLRKQQA